MPPLADESIGIVLFVDPELKRTGQIYVDLKRNERKLPRSRLLLHDNRDKLARVTRQMIRHVPVFDRSTEMVRTTISNRSRKLFTLSAIHHATESLLADRLDESAAELAKTANDYWKEVASCIPDWGPFANGQIAAAGAEGPRSCTRARPGCTCSRWPRPSVGATEDMETTTCGVEDP
jgi:DNA sulfur modification protein DndB